MTTTHVKVRFRPGAERDLLRLPTVGHFAEKVGNEVAASIRDQAPVGATHQLKDGITDAELELTTEGQIAVIRFMAWYSLIVEFSRNGKPFIRPGADAALRPHHSRLQGGRT